MLPGANAFHLQQGQVAQTWSFREDSEVAWSTSQSLVFFYATEKKQAVTGDF